MFGNKSEHRLITMQREHWMSSFLDLWFFFVRNNPETEAQRSYAHVALHDKTERDARNSLELLPLGYFERNPMFRYLAISLKT